MSNNDKQLSLNQILSGIDGNLAAISSETSSNDYYQSIIRTDNILRMTNEAAYEPKMVSIGPYHRGKENLQKMEKYKLEYLQGILKRQNETSAGIYFNFLLLHEEKARRYYAEQVSLTQGEFIKMLLLDGCFIVEFLRKYARTNDANIDHDPIFKMESALQCIRRDLLLFENQIPFFILVKLFNMTKISNNPTPADDDDEEEDTSLISLAVSCLNDAINDKSSSSSDISQPEDVIHLLSLMYESWCSSFAQSIEDEETEDLPFAQNGSTLNGNNRPPEFSCINFGRKNLEEKDKEDLDDIVFIKSVTELKQDGIKFVKSTQGTSWLDIKFEDDEIKIPPLVVQDGTEAILRNLIAYEQYMFDLGYSGKFVTDYTTFMDCLINTPMDVQKLRVKGIIKNRIGSDEEVTNMFNSICKNVFLSPPDFAYRKHFKNVNKYCNERRNKWISDLKKTYFKNPWSIIALIGSTLLLIFTLIQTVFSFLQYFKKDPKVVCNFK